MEENKLVIQNKLSNEEIKNLIYTIREKQVMLDSDVAMLYHYETKNINKAVKRNIDRFPEDFCFQLTKAEMDKMWFQNGTTSKGRNNKYRSEKYLPYAFTEQGIAMLSGVLKYDAYSLIIDIIKKANKKILIIDNYIDDSILKMLTKKKNNVEVVILTSSKSNIENLDIQKFNKEYLILKVAKTNKFHDRFIIIDSREMYHLGASIKDLGKKCFGINKIEDIEIIKKIINL